MSCSGFESMDGMLSFATGVGWQIPEVPEGVQEKVEARIGHPLSFEELTQCLNLPVDRLAVSPETQAVFSQTGAHTVGAVLAQIHFDSSRYISLDRTEQVKNFTSLTQLLDEDQITDLTVELLRMGYFPPEDCLDLSGPYGAWRAVFMTDIEALLDGKRQALLHSAAPELVAQEFAGLFATMATCPDLCGDVLPSQEAYAILDMHYRHLYSDEYTRQALGLTEQEYEKARRDMLLATGQVFIKGVQKLLNEDKQSEKKLARGKKPWFCGLLQTLYPEQVTDEFLTQWRPAGGLKLFGELLQDTIRAAFAREHMRGDAEAFIRCYRDCGGDIRLAAEQVKAPVWEFAKIHRTGLKLMQEPRIRTLLLESKPVGIAGLRKRIQKGKTASWSADGLPLDILNLSWPDYSTLACTFQCVDLDEAVRYLWLDDGMLGWMDHHTHARLAYVQTILFLMGLEDWVYEMRGMNQLDEGNTMGIIHVAENALGADVLDQRMEQLQRHGDAYEDEMSDILHELFLLFRGILPGAACKLTAREEKLAGFLLLYSNLLLEDAAGLLSMQADEKSVDEILAELNRLMAKLRPEIEGIFSRYILRNHFQMGGVRNQARSFPVMGGNPFGR